jgi:hypothetical protein
MFAARARQMTEKANWAPRTHNSHIGETRMCSPEGFSLTATAMMLSGLV